MKNSRIALVLLALSALTAVGFSSAGSNAPQAKDCCATGSSCCTEGAACCK